MVALGNRAKLPYEWVVGRKTSTLYFTRLTFHTVDIGKYCLSSTQKKGQLWKGMKDTDTDIAPPQLACSCVVC